MRCEVIRDLLPIYIEGLTNDVTNQEIEKHIKECDACRKYLAEMKGEVVSEEYAEVCQGQYKEEIKPFKKIKNMAGLMVLITIVLCVIAGNSFEANFVGWFLVKKPEVEIMCKKTENSVILGIIPKNEYLTVQVSQMENEAGIGIIGSYVKHKDDAAYQHIRDKYAKYFGEEENADRAGYCEYTFVDEDTLMNVFTEDTIEVTEDGILVIDFRNEITEIKVKPLYEGKLEYVERND